ncbi:hypothetical protein [Clostridium omnivorum]|uniref:Uncharacterized protein n=1 Tax=Clostridium omnivorum TaxID=1604902 RepID=A0ABQ5NC00_9CLOT|nr:hypothetical protein [Clostridium sp. E14]GLC32803.1 hypothetical protein bsdE14_42130 [Clostridium sp. E14]
MKRFITSILIAFSAMVLVMFSANNVVAIPVENNSTTSLSAIEEKEESAIPKLVKVEQISPNQIQISYDRDVDKKLGEKSTNYWIQDVMNVTPKGIATLGKNDKVNVNNSLTDKLVKISPKEDSSKVFVLTFNQNIVKGEQYKIIICYVTVEGAPAYNGDNGSAIFIGK